MEMTHCDIHKEYIKTCFDCRRSYAEYKQREQAGKIGVDDLRDKRVLEEFKRPVLMDDKVLFGQCLHGTFLLMAAWKIEPQSLSFPNIFEKTFEQVWVVSKNCRNNFL